MWAFDEVMRAARQDGKDIHAVALMLFLDFCEPIDGVSILVRGGSAKNCSQLLRTAFEIELGLRYMMEHKSSYENRCLAYKFYHLRDRLRWAQRCDPKSPIGKQLRAELAGDPLVELFDITGRDGAVEAREIEKMMNSARYTAVRSELERMKAERKKDRENMG
jgi:hypothetical protein